MADRFVLYTRKVLNNPLLGRKQLQIEIVHPDSGNISKTALKERLADMFKSKTEQIAIFGLSSKFGGGRSTGFALMYNSMDDRKKYDSKTSLMREGLFKKKGPSRKQGKEIKGRCKRTRGTEINKIRGGHKK